MTRFAFPSLPLALGGCAALAGCASAPPVARHETPTHVVTLAPGMIDEVCLDLDDGDLLHYSYRATGPVDFNVHFHEDEKVTYAVRKNNAQRVDGSFIPDLDQTYCLMWTNPGPDPVEIRYEFEHVPED